MNSNSRPTLNRTATAWVFLATAATALAVLIVVLYALGVSPASAQPPIPEGVVVGDQNTPGDTTSGPGVILAFEHAYYVRRSAQAARELAGPDTTLPPVQMMQAGIDHTPAHITPATDHTRPDIDTGTVRWWALVLTVTEPEGTTRRYAQTVTTSEHDGRVSITTITAD
ncbi:hypothetical protein ACWEKT_26710 [Nocardia takedensis]